MGGGLLADDSRLLEGHGIASFDGPGRTKAWPHWRRTSRASTSSPAAAALLDGCSCIVVGVVVVCSGARPLSLVLAAGLLAGDAEEARARTGWLVGVRGRKPCVWMGVERGRVRDQLNDSDTDRFKAFCGCTRSRPVQGTRASRPLEAPQPISTTLVHGYGLGHGGSRRERGVSHHRFVSWEA